MIFMVQAVGGLLVFLVTAQAIVLGVGALRRLAHEQERRRLSIELLTQQVQTAVAERAAATNLATLNWTGYRKFEVARKDRPFVPEAWSPHKLAESASYGRASLVNLQALSEPSGP